MVEKPTRHWAFLTNHAQVLVCIAEEPGVRLRDISERVGITERAAHRIVTELAAAGYITRKPHRPAQRLSDPHGAPPPRRARPQPEGRRPARDTRPPEPSELVLGHEHGAVRADRAAAARGYSEFERVTTEIELARRI